MRTTIRLTVTRPDGVPFDKAIQLDPTDIPLGIEWDSRMFSMAFEELTGEFDAWLNKRYAPYVPSIIEEIEEAMYKAKMERSKE